MVLAITQQQGLMDGWIHAQHVFNGLGGNLFTPIGDNQFFFPVCNLDPALGVDFSNVSGMEITFLIKDFSGGGFVIPIPLHDVGTLDKNFTIWGEFQKGFVLVGFENGASNVSGLYASPPRDGNDGAGFGESVAFING